ncbi:MAG: hypothetical protein J7L45_02225 [Candidatus Aenigmarchaeota archaeon]|nr:hypothetical protein [Candidatus Aenigmarchaeota archaeon]
MTKKIYEGLEDDLRDFKKRYELLKIANPELYDELLDVEEERNFIKKEVEKEIDKKLDSIAIRGAIVGISGLISYLGKEIGNPLLEKVGIVISSAYALYTLGSAIRRNSGGSWNLDEREKLDYYM